MSWGWGFPRTGLGAPILLEEAKAAGVTAKSAAPVATPAVDKIKAIGQWNAAWEPFLAIDPGWTDDLQGNIADNELSSEGRHAQLGLIDLRQGARLSSVARRILARSWRQLMVSRGFF
jgi:hypothetical protein